MPMDESKKETSVSLKEFFSYFSDEEKEKELVDFLCDAIEFENDARPNRKNTKSISLRILPFDKAKYMRNRFRAYVENRDEGTYKYIVMGKYKVKTANELITINSLFNANLFYILGEEKMRKLTNDLGGMRLRFSRESWEKMKIINDVRAGIPDYIILKNHDVSPANLRQIRHRLKKAGELEK